MPLQSVVEVFLGPVYAGVGAREAVHLAAHAVVQALLHVRLVVEVGHLPAVFLVVVIVRVRGVVRRCDRLRVRRVRSVVEVHLGAVLVDSRGQRLLWLLLFTRPVCEW